MNKLNNYNSFLFENLLSEIEMVEVFNDADILESIVTDSESLLKSIQAEEIDLFTTFQINPDNFDRHILIEDLYNNNEFNKQLSATHYKKNELESTEETETFLDKTIIIKFFSIYHENKSELDQPEFIVFQSRRKNEPNWSDVKCYKVKEDMKNFYNKLTTKTVEIKKGDKNYIYQTSNSGNDWTLKDIENKDDTFKEDMSTEDIRAILKDKGVSITILA